MGTLGELRQAVADALGQAGALHGVHVVAEYPAATQALPLKTPVIAVGAARVELEPGGLGGYFGEAPDGGASLYGQAAVITLVLEIHTPPQAAGSICHEIYEAACDALILSQNPFGFTRMWCESVSYDRTSFSNHLRAFAVLRTAVTRSDTAISVRDFHLIRQEESS